MKRKSVQTSYFCSFQVLPPKGESEGVFLLHSRLQFTIQLVEQGGIMFQSILVGRAFHNLECLDKCAQSALYLTERGGETLLVEAQVPGDVLDVVVGHL